MIKCWCRTHLVLTLYPQWLVCLLRICVSCVHVCAVAHPSPFPVLQCCKVAPLLSLGDGGCCATWCLCHKSLISQGEIAEPGNNPFSFWTTWVSGCDRPPVLIASLLSALITGPQHPRKVSMVTSLSTARRCRLLCSTAIVTTFCLHNGLVCGLIMIKWYWCPVTVQAVV